MFNPIFECASAHGYTVGHVNDVVTGLLDNFYAVPRNLLEWCSGGVEPALQPQDVKCYLNVGDCFGVFEIATHDLPDFIEPVVERVLMDEEFGGHVDGMRWVCQIQPKRPSELGTLALVFVEQA